MHVFDIIFTYVASSSTGFGFFFYQDSTGTCSSEIWFENATSGDDGEFPGDVKDYIQWLGDDWERVRSLLATAAFFGLGLLIWCLIMSCVAHMRHVRILVGIIPLLIIMPLQYASLTLLNSDFCSTRDCALGRAAIAGSCAGAIYIIASVGLFLTKNFAVNEDEDLDQFGISPEQRQPNASVPTGAVEMVEIVEDASYVIEETRAAGHVEEVVIGDGLAEAQEIKPDMIFLPEDGETTSEAADGSAEDEIPTVTDVQVLDDD